MSGFLFLSFFIFYLFIFRERGREGEREGEKHQCVVASHAPLLGTWPATQACALTGNWTGDHLIHGPVLNPISHTSQGRCLVFKELPVYFAVAYRTVPTVSELVWCPRAITEHEDWQIFVSYSNYLISLGFILLLLELTFGDWLDCFRGQTVAPKKFKNTMASMRE